MFLKNNYSYLIPLAIFILLQLPVLDTTRPIMVDEAWYSNPSYNFIVSHSFINTNTAFGGNGLLTYSVYLSTFFYFFGVSLFTARLSSFCLGIISIFLLRKMLKILNVSEFSKFLSLSFFILANLYLSIFMHARPEALAFALSLCLLLILYFYLKNDFSIKLLLLLVLLSFLAINSHPYSSIIILLAYIIILYFIIKKSKYSKIYHLAIFVFGVAFSSFFIIWMSSMNNNNSLSESLSIILQRNSLNTSFWENLLSKFKVTINYFIISNRIITFLPQISIIILGLFNFKKNKHLFSLSLYGMICLFIALVFISSSGFIYIYIYVFIFSALSLPLLIEAKEKGNISRKLIIFFSLLIIFSNIIAYIVFTKKTYDPDINKTMKEIDYLLPQNSIIISEQPFWFISPQKNIKTVRYFENIDEYLYNKNFYIIDCDKFKSEYKNDSNSLARFDSYSENHNKDTLFIKRSNIYGNIYLIKFANK